MCLIFHSLYPCLCTCHDLTLCCTRPHRCASCYSSVVRGSCVCRSGSRLFQSARKRRSSGTWPTWCWHGNRAHVTSWTGKTLRLFTSGGCWLTCRRSKDHHCFSPCAFIIQLPQPLLKTSCLLCPQICKPVFLLGHREPGEWAASIGDHSPLCGAVGQILWQCISQFLLWSCN